MELRDKGTDADLATVEREMRERDERDSARSAAPLKPADDAIVIDTSDMDADAAFQMALRVVRNRLASAR